MIQVEFERQIRVSMGDGSSRVIPLVEEAIPQLAIEYRAFGERMVLSFSLHGFWSCLRTAKIFDVWSAPILAPCSEGRDFVRAPVGPDVFVDVRCRSRLTGWLQSRNSMVMLVALDNAFACAELDRRLAAGETASDIRKAGAGPAPPVGLFGLVDVSEQSIGGRVVKSVNARDLHKLLLVVTPFLPWIDELIGRLKLARDVDYKEANFADVDHTRSVRQVILTEHAGRGICLADTRVETIWVRARLRGEAVWDPLGPSLRDDPGPGGSADGPAHETGAGETPPYVAQPFADEAVVRAPLEEDGIFSVIEYSAATVPLTMEEFLRFVGVPERMARAEAAVWETDLVLDVMSSGEGSAGFRHPASNVWLFYRPILVDWWEKAASRVAASIRRRYP